MEIGRHIAELNTIPLQHGVCTTKKKEKQLPIKLSILLQALKSTLNFKCMLYNGNKEGEEIS